MIAIQLRDIQKKYEAEHSFTLRVDDLSIKEGEMFALIGPSGCGKTTLLKLIAGLSQPDRGEIYSDGKPMTHISAEKRGFGMVFQQPLLFPHMTVEENVAFGLKMKGVSKKERIAEARRFLERVGLEGFGSRLPTELSGGQQQRVSMVRSLITQPKVLLLDEPFSALDPGLREEMRKWLKQLHIESQATMILVTHDREEAMFLADRMAVMSEGKLLQTDQPEAIYRRPATPEVAEFMGMRNLIRGEIHDDIFTADGWKIPFKRERMKNQAGWLLLPPYAFALADSMSEFAVEATVREIRFLQGTYQLIIETGPYRLDMIGASSRFRTIQPGDRIRMVWEQQDLHFIPLGWPSKGGKKEC